MNEPQQEPPGLSRKHYSRLLLAVPAVSLLLMIFLITTSRPGEGGPAVILAFLLLLFFIIGGITANGVQIVLGVKRSHSVSGVRLLYTSVSVAAGVTLLVGLQTLGQLGVMDIVLVLVFELLLIFYLIRRF